MKHKYMPGGGKVAAYAHSYKTKYTGVTAKYLFSDTANVNIIILSYIKHSYCLVSLLYMYIQQPLNQFANN